MRYRLVLFAAGMIASTPVASVAHEDPNGCFITGAFVQLQLFRSDGVTLVSGPIQDCEQVFYRTRLSKAADNDSICAFSGGSFTLTTPDGTPHVVSSNVPCLGGNLGLEGCDPTNDFLESALIPYTASPGDVSGGQVAAQAAYTGGVVHDSPPNTPGISANTVKGTVVVACTVTTTSSPSTTTTTTLLPKSSCTSGKITAAGKLSLALAKCKAKAVKGGVAVLQSCRDKAFARFAAKWASLETKPDCLTSGDQASIESLIDACATSLANSLIPSQNP